MKGSLPLVQSSLGLSLKVDLLRSTVHAVESCVSKQQATTHRKQDTLFKVDFSSQAIHL